ncbi:Uncharacterised protein [Mycobacteroides abscessus subsp. abscessus]|nr:Uncharacterised protein [Mycobacteroides abscessus subsp. abscessus]
MSSSAMPVAANTCNRASACSGARDHTAAS